ncbi:hypothetical protein WJX73_001647 [Symbiochloris irregularis]|uniref:F-box domain-containing protein n=1 Tax=Symbiochloris irregularis TaxID=706552 RepID=A0AAW1NUK4_9CHLO
MTLPLEIWYNIIELLPFTQRVLCQSLPLPITSWLDTRADGVRAVKLKLACCRYPESCPRTHRHLPEFLACLLSVPVAVHLDFECFGAWTFSTVPFAPMLPWTV